MPKKKQINNVPASNVGKVVQSFITNDGATKVTATENSDGTWTVVAEF